MHILFYSQINMSLHEGVFFSSATIVISSILWKWSKSILLIINLEMASVIMISVFLYNSLLYAFLLFIMVFFVGEALIMLSALYSSMSVTGVVFSSMLFW